MKQVLIKQGRAVVEDVPAPEIEAGTLLVRVSHSCISAGTEMSGIRASAEPLWKRAVRDPAKVGRVLKTVMAHGMARARSDIEHNLHSGQATGYAAAGTVVAAGEGVSDLFAADKVACAGGQCAHHAEFIRVPRNLTVPVPEGLSLAAASTVTLGAIALQGVRRAQPTLGETLVVLGLGALGQLTSQLLKANGCRVIGTDLNRDRLALALKLGMDLGVHPSDGSVVEQVERLTGGIGADGVIITAASPSDDVVSTAFRMCRRKARVVLVGDVGLNLDRRDFYEKEIDFLISTSYGPGRYDARYEEHGVDYPVSYVRWTENRNMAEYLRLLSENRVSVETLISAVYPVGQAAEAYHSLEATGTERPVMVLLSYPETSSLPEARAIPNPRALSAKGERLRLAVVGAGSFARSTHLPNLRILSDLYHLQAVVSRTGHNAQAAATQFGANYATTRYQDVLTDPDVDAVLIATRHNLHASMALEALIAGKHVLLEKPMALSRHEVRQIREFFEDGPDRKKPLLLTGFNRRFSPIGVRMRELMEERSSPLILDYRMNAGHIPLEHWVHTLEGGGRNLGEACHIYDLFTYLTGSGVKRVQAEAVRGHTGHSGFRDNFTALLGFEDGSLATLTYTALGSPDYPKEKLEAYWDGKVLSMEDFRRLALSGAATPAVEGKAAEKGQKQELEAFARAIRCGGEWPIALWQQIQATEIALRVEECLAEAQSPPTT